MIKDAQNGRAMNLGLEIGRTTKDRYLFAATEGKVVKEKEYESGLFKKSTTNSEVYRKR